MMRPTWLKPLAVIAGAVLLTPGWSHAASIAVDQKNKQFSQKAIKAKVGDTIEFRNSDTVTHNIFSLSEAKTFDLGTYGPGEKREIKLDAAGKIEVECSLHPAMKLTIEVSK